MASIVDSLRRSSEALSGESATADMLRRVPIDSVERDPSQPRTSLEEKPDEHKESLEELAQSIREQGVLQPPTVSHEPASGRYILISGERRWRAAKMAGLLEIPVIVRGSDRPRSEETRRIEALTENLQREDLSLWETASALQEILRAAESLPPAERLNATTLATKLGKSKTWVSLHLAVAKSTGAALDAAREGFVRDPYAFSLFKQLPAEERDRLLARLRNDGGVISRIELERATKRVEKAAQDVGKPPAEFLLRIPLLKRAAAERLFQMLELELPESDREATRVLLEALEPRQDG